MRLGLSADAVIVDGDDDYSGIKQRSVDLMSPSAKPEIDQNADFNRLAGMHVSEHRWAEPPNGHACRL